MRRTSAITIVVLTVATIIPVAARATDGVLEINQACVATGCFPGDAPGFPISLASGSYVLTSALVVPDAATIAISGGDDVSLDLNGFAILGVTNCTGAPAVCTGTGVGRGISLGQRAMVRNGTIRKMGNKGVDAGTGSIFENLTVAENGGDGITSATGGKMLIIRNCRVLQNGQEGINMYTSGNYGTLVTGSTIYGNGGYGIQGIGLSAIDNVITHNGDEGLYIATYSTRSGNKVSENNGGNANAQVFGGTALGPNLCGTSLCP